MHFTPMKRDDETSFIDHFSNMFDNFWPRNRNGLLKTDVSEDEKYYWFKIDVPGFTKKDIKLTLSDGYLTVSVKTSEQMDENPKSYLRRERFYGQYERSFYLGDVKDESVHATYDNGVLSVKIAKAETKSEQDQKYIPIQ